MTTAFVLFAALLALAMLVWVSVPLVAKRIDGRAAMPYQAAAVSLLLLGGAGALYAALSSYDWQQAATRSDSPEAMVSRLARRLERSPDDLDGWLQLGRSYAVLEQFPLAVRAYQRADQLAQGRNAEALSGLAEALAMRDPNQLDGRAGQLFEQALAIDPTAGKALFFSGAAALRRGELALARERFAKLLALDPPENVRPILEQQLAALDQRLGAQTAGPAADGASTAAAVAVRVTLSDELRAADWGGAPLFVFVREPGAAGPPLAVKRLASAFPVEITLSAADAMLADRTFAVGQTVEVTARIARGGSPTAVSGDPVGSVRYQVGKDGLAELVIDQLTP
ncbi:MAG TPA: hypothetical protein P5528_05085 [Steroidobacteraceae bacterium]|nr:hypothetical protein [Steroidobacteraceae bacterium]HRX88802.1 hypothetical protein [Steroidobacteraceae bacterium]